MKGKYANLNRVGRLSNGVGPPQYAASGMATMPVAFMISVGGVIGYTLIPPNAGMAGAMVFPAEILSVSLLLPLMLDCVRGGIKRALNIRNLLFVGIVYWILVDLIQGLHDIEATNTAIKTAFSAVVLFAVGVGLGAGLPGPGLPHGIRRVTLIDPTPRELLYVIFACFLLGTFYYVYKANFSLSLIAESIISQGRFSAPWSRGALGGWDAFIEHLSYFGYLLPLLTVVLAEKSGRVASFAVLFGALASTTFLLFLIQGGSRRSVGAILGAAILVGVLLSRRRMRLLHVTVLVMCVSVIQIFMNIIVANRNIGYRELEIQRWMFEDIRVDDNFNRLAQTVDLVPEVFPYDGFGFVTYAIIRPIPRALWPGKPTSPGFKIHVALGWENTSLSSSVVGESYAGYGLPFVFVMGVFFGVAARWWQQALGAEAGAGNVLLYGIGTMALFVGLRGFVNVVLLSYPVLALWAGVALFKFRNKATPTDSRKL